MGGLKTCVCRDVPEVWLVVRARSGVVVVGDEQHQARRFFLHVR